MAPQLTPSSADIRRLVWYCERLNDNLDAGGTGYRNVVFQDMCRAKNERRTKRRIRYYSEEEIAESRESVTRALKNMFKLVYYGVLGTISPVGREALAVKFYMARLEVLDTKLHEVKKFISMPNIVAYAPEGKFNSGFKELARQLSVQKFNVRTIDEAIRYISKAEERKRAVSCSDEHQP